MSQSPVAPEDVAQWMCDEFTKSGELYQADAADRILMRFGSAFLFDSVGGNRAIRKKVLAAFKRLTRDDAVWDPWEKKWRRRSDQTVHLSSDP